MQAETQTTEQVEYVVIDGIRYDAETGECYGPDQAQPFAVTDEASADWVLEKMLDADLEARKLRAKLKSITDNLGQQIKALDARVTGLERRFGPELRAYFEANPPKKGKTLKLTFGQLSMKTVPGGLRVRESEAALALAERRGWEDAIKVTREFRVSGLSDEQLATIERMLARQRDELGEMLRTEDEQIADLAFEIKPDEERFSVKVGA